MAASISKDGRFRAVFLSVIMVLMTQVGYTDNMDFSIGLNQDTESKDTGGSTSNSSSNNLSPSRDNVVATVGEPMAEISWYHDVSPSGGNAGTTTQGNGTVWIADQGKHIHHSSVRRQTNIGATIGDTFYYVATGGEKFNTSRVIYSYNKSSETASTVGTFGTMPAYQYGTYSGSLAMNFFTNVGDVLLFDGPGIDNITAYNSASDTVYSIGVSYSGQSGSGTGYSILVGDTLYFSGYDSTTSSVGAGLYAYTAGNNTTWLAADINPPSSDANYTVPMSSRPGYHHGFRLIGDTIYFDGAKGHRTTVSSWSDEILYNETSGLELFAYNPSNHTSWQVTDIDNRSPQFNGMGQLQDHGNGLDHVICYKGGSNFQYACDENTMTVVGSTLFFSGQDSNGDVELWAHDSSNHTTWQVANINTLPSDYVSDYCNNNHPFESSFPSGFYTVGDTVYFFASNGYYGQELWAYDTSNNSVWQVTRFTTCVEPYEGFSNSNTLAGVHNFNVIGDELIFIRNRGLYIHNDSSQQTIRLYTPNKYDYDNFFEWKSPGAVVMGDTLYGIQASFSETPSSLNFNPSQVTDPPASGGAFSNGMYYAYDTSNDSLFSTGVFPSGAFPGSLDGDLGSELLMASDETIFISQHYYSTSYQALTSSLLAHQPAEISYPRERVTEANCSISPSLPAGLALDINQCAISGTPTTQTSQASYTVTAVINNITYQGNVLLATSYYPIEPSVTGSNVRVGTPIDDITFQIDPTVGIGSGTGGFSVSDNSRTNPIGCSTNNDAPGCAALQWYGSDYRSNYGSGLSFDWSGMIYADAIIDALYVDGSLGLKEYFDIAVDSNGYVHIVYLASSNQDGIRYATNQSGSWQSFEIEQNVTGMSSIAVDSNDNVHIAYFSSRDSSGNAYANGNFALKHATVENGSWAISILETGIDQDDATMYYGRRQYKIIAIDSNDKVHIAFKDGGIKIANNTDGSWTVSSVNTTTEDIANQVILAIDSNDGLHLLWETYAKIGGYYSNYHIKVVHSNNQSGTWSSSIIDTIDTGLYGSSGWRHRIAQGSMVVDSYDNLHYFNYKGTMSSNSANYRVKHYALENGSWTNSTLSNSFCVLTSSHYCSLDVVIDSNDVIHITHEISEDDVFGHNFLQYSNNANGYFGETVELEPATRSAEMVVHTNGDVDFIYLQKVQTSTTGLKESLVLTSMNNSELNPALPMYENNKIATGYNHSCGILHDNSLVCWGSDYYGQLGDGGTNTDRAYVATYLPVDLGSGRTALAVAAGHSHTCAILDDGSLKCWGDNSHGQLGDGSTTDRTSPVQVDLGSGNTAVSISAGHSHTCAILQDGTLKCWGQDNNGQIGDGGTNSDQSSPVTINLGSSRTAGSVSAGIYHTCAVLDDGSIKCWGLNNEGQLGDGSTTTRTTPVSVNLDAGKIAFAVAAGMHHTCALVDSHVECWGINDQNQLKLPSSSQNQSNPVTTRSVTYHGEDFSKPRAISAGYNHTCVVSDKTMNCWGNRTDSTSSNQYFPCRRDDCWYETTALKPHEDMGLDIDRHIAVSSYGNRHCAITSKGKVICRGYFAEDSNLETDRYLTTDYSLVSITHSDFNLHQWNNTAEPGSGTSPFIVRYEDVKYKFSGGGNTGTFTHPRSDTTCLVHSTYVGNSYVNEYADFYDQYGYYDDTIDQWKHRDGALVCRGISYGQGDMYTRLTSEFVSMDIPEERTVEYISPGNRCVILDDGSLMCWGYNYHGQVGDGSSYATTGPNSNKYSPVYVNLGAGRTAIAVDDGEQHTCAILDNGVVKCWGNNDYGQLGDGSTTSSPTPVSVSLPAGRNAVALASGGYHNCAILDNGSVMCWGYNSNGQLGNGNPATHGAGSSESSPVYIDLGTNQKPVMIDSGPTTSCVIFENGSLMCWGYHGTSTTGLPAYYNLPAGYGAIDLAVERYSSTGTNRNIYVLLDDNRVCRSSTLSSCYYVDYDRPDNGPVYDSADLTAVAISAGSYGFCAVLVDGALRCTKDTSNHDLVHTYNSVGGTSIYTRASSAHSSGGMTGISGATCTVSPALPAGLSIDSSTCTISGTPTVETSNTTYTVTANISGTTYQGTVWLATMTFGTITSPVMGAELDLGEAMTPITLNYASLASPQAPAVSWEIHPELPEGMTLVNGVISGTPTVYAVNQTYTIYANQSGQTTTFDMYFSVDTNNPHTVVENQPIDPIGFHGPFQNGTTNWTVSPALPADLVMDPNTGEITGSVNGVLANTTYTVTATHGSSGSGGSTGTGATETFTFSLESLGDLDGDGLPNELPSDYDAAEGPTPGLVADTDDDADGLEDVVETGTSIYVDNNDTGSNPLDPDTDDDGICDGPNAVPPICVAGPDSAPNGDGGPPIWIGLFNTEGASLGPYKSLPGGTYEIMPDLPQSLTMDPNTGVISGTPTQTLENTTFTVWVNRSDGASLSWNFSIEILADSDGDGLPDELPDDYDPSNPTAPGLVEDLDDDNDGIPDSEEGDGLDSTNPDTDGDGYCDGQISVDPICVAGPDAFPLDPSAHTDTDGDGKPDTITGNSTLVPPLEEDMDDDGDGVEDVNETGTWTYNGPTDTGTNPLNPDTDYDGVCDGPVDVYHPQTGDLICVAGPDTDLGNLAVGAHYAVNGSAIETIRPEWFPTGAVWEVSPDLPADLTINPDNGIISGIPKEVTENITYTIYGNGTFSDYTSTFNLQVLEDTDRDGLPNALPDDYDNSTVTPMVEDLDDDGDGLSDLAETGTGVYNGTSDYGTDPLNPDTDGDGVCDGPNSVWPICINGPDSNPFGTHDGVNIVLVENIAIETPIPPPNQVPGAVWEISPALPAGLNLDISSGIITGTATEVSDNTTYTLWANVSDFGRSDSVALSVMATFGLTVLEDSDGDGMPNELPDDYDPTVGILVEDLDDDNDGLLDTEEASEGTNPLDPDSDGDGFCDGPTDVYANDGTLVCRGPDPEPLDSTLPVDTDGDMFPDEDPDGEGGLVADSDDDGDGFSDELENNCGSDSLDANDNPSDMDGDTICDLLDPDIDGDGLNNTVETNTGIFISDADSGTDPYNPDTDGDGYCDGPVSPNYSNCTAGPDAFPTDASAHLDTDGDGNPDTITGNSTTGLIEDLDDDGDGIFDSVEAGCGTDPLDASETPELDSEGNCVEKQASAESLFEWSWSWCFCLIFLLLLLLLIPIVMQRDRILVMVGTGPEPENTVSEPEFKDGAGTLENPFILEPSKKIKAGESISSKEVITIDSMTVRNVEMIDLNQEDNGDKFSMYETGFDEIGVRLISVGDDGEITINMHFDDSVGGATYAGGEFTGLLKLGSASVYLSWTVNVKPDKKKLKEIEKAEKEAKKAAEEAAAKEAEEKAAREAEEAEARKKAEEEAAALLAEEEAEAAALLAKEEEEKAAKEAEEKAAKEAEEAEAKKKAEEEAAAKEAEEKAAKEAEEAEAKKKAEEEAAAAALLAKEEEEKAAKEAEEAEAKKKADAEAKKAKEAEEKAAKEAEEAEAKKKAEAEAKKKAKKPASAKEAKKQEELQRVKERAKTIDFKVIGKASSSELKSEVKKGAKTLEVADASEFADSGSAQITDEDGSSVIAWTGKDGNTLTGVTGVKRVYGAASIVVVKDDLQVIKGVGPFIEEKLNALGITTYRQIANMNAKLEKQVNEAIEFFPGRVKRDQWVAQAKILLGEDVKLDEKALKQAEELERVAKKAEKIDFKTIGVASASDRDNLQELKGIGPFIEEKLNALGIFKFEQIAKMTSKIEDEVNIAIEFFPGRVKRDQWVAQAKIKIGEDVELDQKALEKAEELERVAKKAEKIDFKTIGVASASEKDNLQELKGIGPFIEEKLNALGIFKFEQIAKMTSKIEDEVNIAIEFFPGRVKRDEWVKQAKERTK